MRTSGQEIEVKLLVPRGARAALAAALARKPAAAERRTLVALYLDTPDRRLARAGLVWRVRREGRRWVQALKADGSSAIGRFEHEVVRPDSSHDATAHAATGPGDRLIGILHDAREAGQEVQVRFRTEIRRLIRRIRTRGAVVEVAFDEGWLLADGARSRIRELELELVSGSAAAMVGLAQRWQERFGLVYDPRSKSERGDRLAEGVAFPPVRKARPLRYARDAGGFEAFGAVLDECLSQVSRNAIGLVDGDPALRAEHVHQARVGIRRLRSGLRSFRGWVPDVPDALTDDLRRLFAELGRVRDSDVLDSGVAAELERAGAPPLVLARGRKAPDPAAIVSAPAAQRMLLAWIAWRVALDEAGADPPVPSPGAESAVAAAGGRGRERDGHEEGTAAGAQPAPRPGIKDFPRAAQRRLRRWHQRIVDDGKVFDDLDEEGLHSLRKRIKRQRYAVEFFAPALRRRDIDRYLEPLTALQERMGELNDLFVARARYQALVDSRPAAWFALGWLSARIAVVRTLAGSQLGLLAKADPPRR